MSKIEKLSIAVTREQAETIRQAVQDGEFASTSEAVRDALRDWEQKRAAIQRVRQLWDEGIASGIAKERRPLEEFLRDARARLAKVRAE